MTDIQADLAKLRFTLDTVGIGGALQLLNARVAHRCTAIYRLDKLTLQNVALYDRTGETNNLLISVPLSDSFCQHVIRDGRFTTHDSAQDPRLQDHPYRGVVVSYYGLPLMRGPDDLFGTFCHLDYVERSLPDSEMAFLEKAVRLLPAYL